MRFALSLQFSFAFSVFLTPMSSSAEPKPNKQSTDNVPALIDKLVEVTDSNIGYSATVSGSSFLPLEREGQVRVGRLFQQPSVPSATTREIVKQGAAAVPHLIAHLGDKRKTKIVVSHDGGLGGMFYGDELDYNERTSRPPPTPARREDEEDGLARLFGASAKEAHTITVGDLCFVALGQIVNRQFNAVRYQPTAIVIVSSPTHSPSLLTAIKKEWGTLTPERHRALLVADFLKPDSEDRRNGACKRLAFYYPDALEPLVLRFLAQPAYDGTDVRSFLYKTLYPAKDARERRTLVEAYLIKKGSAAREGIRQQLFADLEKLEAEEENRWSRRTKFGTKPRELLIEIYGYKKDVRSKQCPLLTDVVELTQKARLIEEGLIYDRRTKIDRAVRDLLVSIEQNDYLAGACMQRLVGRGYDADIEKYCRRRLPQREEADREDLQQMLDKLGWNLVHVAVDRHDGDGLRNLIAEGANLQKSARNGMTPLHLAAASGDSASLKLLLAAKVNLNPKNIQGETPVQLAARADRDEAVLFLVEKGCAVPDLLTAVVAGQRDRAADLLAKDPKLVQTTTAHKRMSLHLAARWGYAPIVELLLDKGASVNVEDKDGWTPLLVAVTSRHESIARVLLDHKADMKKHLPDGRGALHLAAQTGDAKLVKLLLAYKADVNAGTAYPFATPLHFAVVKGSATIAELLLDAGAAVEARDEEGRAPLHVAAELGQAEVARVLLKHKADVTAVVRSTENYAGYQPLHIAAAEGHVSVMELLLAHKADPQAGASRGNDKPLHLAAQRGHIEAARLLLKRGADVNSGSDSQPTPLSFAARSGHPAMIRFLLANKADILAAPKDGWGPLSMAVAYGGREAVRALLDHKPEINSKEKEAALRIAAGGDDPALLELLLNRGTAVDVADAKGRTPLHCAASGGSSRVARVLLDHKANVRATLKDTGAEPIHQAAAHGSPKMAALLLERGADINARQKNDGRTALHRAVEEDDDEGHSRLAMVAFLLQQKPDYTLKDKGGLTALGLAIKKKRTDIVEFLRKNGVKE